MKKYVMSTFTVDPFALVDELTMNDLQLTEIETDYKLELSLTKPEKIIKCFSEYFSFNPQSVPKIIHQIWIGPHTPPWKWINSFKIDFKNQFPDWEYRLWREEDIAQLKMLNQDLYQQENVFSGKTDILRYELLYQFGGIYIDADSEWLNNKPLNELIHKTNTLGVFAGREDEVMLAAGVIGASKKNPIIYLIIKILHLTFFKTRIEKNYPTWIALGPRFFSEVIKYFAITKFPTHFFYPVSWLQNNLSIDTSQFPESYMMQYGYTSNALHKFM